MADAKTGIKTLEEMRAEIHTQDSKISLIAQKLKTLEQNQEVIGRTIVMHNEKLRGIEENGAGAKASVAGAGVSGDAEKRVAELEKQVKELKYLLESVNPLEYATIEQVKELIEDKMKK